MVLGTARTIRSRCCRPVSPNCWSRAVEAQHLCRLLQSLAGAGAAGLRRIREPNAKPRRQHRGDDPGHPSRPRRVDHRGGAWGATGLAGLSVAALGVVFGDIGTSPVYTFRECFNPEHGLPLDAEHALGVLSMIFWALIIVVTIKYVLLIMCADNQGEGGILALLALALERARDERSRNLLVLLALGGAALFYGDSMITPAISVLSAVEGIGVATPALNRFVLPLTVVVLLALFLFQKGGTGRVGHLFGPVMVLWFLVIAVNGALQIAEAPGVLAALNPGHAVGIFVAAPAAGFI